MTNSSNEQLWIVVETEEVTQTEPIDGVRDGRDTGGGYGSPTVEETVQIKRKRVSIDALALKTQMDGLLAIVGDLFDRADEQTGMTLNEVELTVEINAEGQVSLVGNGAKLGNTGGITLKFVRP